MPSWAYPRASLSRSLFLGLVIMATLITLAFFSTILHECGHLLASTILGIPGHMEYSLQSFSGSFCNESDYTSLPQQTTVLLSGGCFAALVYGLLLLAVRRSPILVPGLIVAGVTQLGYGLGEGVSYQASIIGALLGAALGSGLALAYLRRFLLRGG